VTFYFSIINFSVRLPFEWERDRFLGEKETVFWQKRYRFSDKRQIGSFLTNSSLCQNAVRSLRLSTIRNVVSRYFGLGGNHKHDSGSFFHRSWRARLVYRCFFVSWTLILHCPIRFVHVLRSILRSPRFFPLNFRLVAWIWSLLVRVLLSTLPVLRLWKTLCWSCCHAALLFKRWVLTRSRRRQRPLVKTLFGACWTR